MPQNVHRASRPRVLLPPASPASPLWDLGPMPPSWTVRTSPASLSGHAHTRSRHATGMEPPNLPPVCNSPELQGPAASDEAGVELIEDLKKMAVRRCRHQFPRAAVVRHAHRELGQVRHDDQGEPEPESSSTPLRRESLRQPCTQEKSSTHAPQAGPSPFIDDCVLAHRELVPESGCVGVGPPSRNPRRVLACQAAISTRSSQSAGSPSRTSAAASKSVVVR